jgi:hypothetical protein
MPRKKLDTVRVHLLLAHRQYKRVQALSETSGYSISELCRRALDDYLAANKKVL